MAIPGIPNSYKGRNYRSLLETRWAIMFEKFGWQSEYEPFELNGWIPDFILIGKRHSVLVEVKPFTHIEQYDDALAKIDTATSGTDYEYSDILLLGVNPGTPCRTWQQSISLGWMVESFDDGYACAQARLWMWNPSGSEFYFCLGSDEHGFYDRMHNVDPYESDCLSFEYFKAMWADAGSKTQWKAPSFASKAAASQAEARRRIALPQRKAPAAMPMLEVDASPMLEVDAPPMLPRAFKGDGLKMRMVMKELHRLNRGLALMSLDESQQITCEGDAIVATFNDESMFSSRLATYETLFRDIGMRLFKRPLKIEVRFSCCTNQQSSTIKGDNK